MRESWSRCIVGAWQACCAAQRSPADLLGSSVMRKQSHLQRRLCRLTNSIDPSAQLKTIPCGPRPNVPAHNNAKNAHSPPRGGGIPACAQQVARAARDSLGGTQDKPAALEEPCATCEHMLGGPARAQLASTCGLTPPLPTGATNQEHRPNSGCGAGNAFNLWMIRWYRQAHHAES